MIPDSSLLFMADVIEAGGKRKIMSSMLKASSGRRTSNEYDQLTSFEVEVIKTCKKRQPVAKSQLASILWLIHFTKESKHFVGTLYM